jgi:hypothetical protein
MLLRRQVAPSQPDRVKLASLADKFCPHLGNHELQAVIGPANFSGILSRKNIWLRCF